MVAQCVSELYIKADFCGCELESLILRLSTTVWLGGTVLVFVVKCRPLQTPILLITVKLLGGQSSVTLISEILDFENKSLPNLNWSKPDN